jgi:hypothetical protein
MFEFLKSKKANMRPEELGMTLATVLFATWLQKIIDYVMEFKELPNITESELSGLWQTILFLHCGVVSTAIESSSIQDDDRRIILDAFWNTVSDWLRENIAEQEAAAFEANTATLYPKVRKLIVDTPTTGMGPGKVLFEIAMPQREVKPHLDTIDELSSYFFATKTALTQFTEESIKKTKLEKSLLAHE